MTAGKVDRGPLVTAWLNELDMDSTRESYERNVGWFVDWLAARHPGMELTDVKRATAGEYAAHVRAVATAQGRPLGPSARAARLSVVSSFYGYLVDAGHVDHNPLYKMKRPKVSRDGRTPAREQADLDAMWEAAGSERDALIVGLLSTSGLRVMELVRSDVTDLQWDAGVRVVSCRVKGGKRRLVPVPNPLLAPLAEYVGDRAKGPLILADNGERLTRDKVAVVLRRAARAAHLRDPGQVRPHVMRASAITNLLEDGAQIQEVQAMMGHASSDTTNRYNRRRSGIKRDKALTTKLSAGMKPRTPRPIPAPREDESA